jgi:hypothetical protein
MKRRERAMKQTRLRTLTIAGLFVAAMTTVLHAQQVPIPTTAAQVPGPAQGTAMTKSYVQAVARMAYFWGWPLVNAANRALAFSKAPEPGLMGGVIPVARSGGSQSCRHYQSLTLVSDTTTRA